MIKNKQTRRTIAIFLLLFSLVCKINAQGPISPEVTAFEPVDATDMVNLVTGDLSYVLPILNIPSPEGGYPLALSYHAGIAMDQEASWVGLGWNINPGVLNRSVSGIPDDWGGDSKIKEFFYDKGYEENYYSFSIGGALPNGITIGLGASWGSNRAFGGSVSLGHVSYGRLTIDSETGPSFSTGLSAGGLSLGMSSNSGLSFGVSTGLGNTGLMLGGQFNTSSGFSGSIMLSRENSIGVSLNSNGFSASYNNNSVSSFGSISKVNKDDIYFNDDTSGFGLDLGFFWIGYSHRKIEYQLYKFEESKTTGILYPYANNSIENFLQNKDYFMDLMIYDVNSHISWVSRYSADFLYPDYDRYNLNAQGLSGSISPAFFEEVPLYLKGETYRSDYYGNGKYVTDYNKEFVVDPVEAGASIYKLNNKVNFHFNKSVNSFLRISKQGTTRPFGDGVAGTSPSEMLQFTSINDVKYNTIQTSNGDLLKSNNRKREGSYIQTFTNQDILSSTNNVPFFEAKGIDRNDVEFEREGIGAFQITAMDGKTYHYSLPVYNFENVYRNIGDKETEEEAFYEKIQTKQYATHWLLTAVTGPDYVDVNNNGELDSEDYGYWVEFEYGKWSDGFGWRTPSVGFDRYYEKNYYSWGRKQIYYLDAIRTRTHTALFVKSLREDNQGAEIIRRNKSYFSGEFNVTDYSKSYVSRKEEKIGDYDLFYDSNGKIVSVAKVDSKRRLAQYLDIPKNKTLKLSKIILIKNNKSVLQSLSKNIGQNLTSIQKGNIHFNNGYNATMYVPYITYTNPNILTSFNSHFSDKVLDVNDIDNLNIEKEATKVITFNYNYELAKNTPTSQNISKGRLTLKEVVVAGKQSTVLIPPYKFEYLNTENYDKANVDDWGYHKTKPWMWSLDQITTPTGSKIKLEYESDSYKDEAIRKNDVNTKLYTYALYADDPNLDPNDPYAGNEILDVQKVGEDYFVYFDPNLKGTSLSIEDSFYINEKIDLKYYNARYYDGQRWNSNQESLYSTKCVIEEINTTEYYMKLKFIEHGFGGRYLDFCGADLRPVNETGEGDEYCRLSYSLVSNSSSYTSAENPNGKLGGGIRVKNIQVQNDTGVSSSVNYYYLSNDRVSGITCYTPKSDDNRFRTSFVKYSKDIPSPGVFYSNVQVVSLDSNEKVIGTEKYEFETLSPYYLNSLYNLKTYTLDNGIKVNLSVTEKISGEIENVFYEYTLKDYSSNLGRLLRIQKFNKEDQLLSDIKYKYKKNLDKDSQIGVNQETFRAIQRLEQDDLYNNYGSDRVGYFYGLFSKVNYPSVLESVEETSGGLTVTKHFDKHDFLTGQVLETRTYASDGTAFKTKAVPAYTINEYSKMGSKVDDINNKNMLTQEAANYSYIYKDNDWKPLGVGITTWNNVWDYIGNNGNSIIDEELNNYPNDGIGQQQRAEFLEKIKVWRKHKTYTWKGAKNEDGTLDFTEADGSVDFNWGIGLAQTTNWQETSNVTKYNQFSQPIEIKDINGNYAATKMGDNYSKVIATANAGYDEMHYSGAEYLSSENPSYFDGGISSQGRTADKAHTGKYSVKATSSVQGYLLTMRNSKYRPGKYKVSVWVDKANYGNIRINDGSLKAFNGEKVFAGEWVLMTHYFDLTTGDKNIYVTVSSGTSYIDDFRLHPVSSSMMSYVYNEWDEVSYITGANGLSTHYIYDAAGRLIETQVETVTNVSAGIEGGFEKVSENRYNYKRNNQ
ncbi:hypothetical protein [Tenacibaculum sp.]|uniref:RHS repeat domain-containing protein n=1 Tax=Tenacibaculum sp. TaxID=1906242 RepID=UPI003AA8CCAA